MSSYRLRARRPEGRLGSLRVVCEADMLASHLEDAAHFPGGHARELVAPANEAEVAAVLRRADTVLAIGAQSSLTGGATPFGEVLLSTSRLDEIVTVSTSRVRVGAGVTIAALDDRLAPLGRYYPPVPTFNGAAVGGVVATNAAGAATFKYGTTRHWVEALTVVLPDGDVLDIERGATKAHRDGYFDLDLAGGTVRVPVPRYRMPPGPKLSAGYYAAPEMDLIDLFIGSEGTLGIVTEITLRVLPHRPARCLAFVPFASRHTALSFVRLLRAIAEATWAAGDSAGLDVAAIEQMDRRCLAIAREDGVDRRSGVRIPTNAAMALLIAIELPPGTQPAQAFDDLGSCLDRTPPSGPLGRFAAMLGEAGVLDDVEIAVPGDDARAGQLLEVRESIPMGVNHRIARTKRAVDPRIQKTAADIIVPLDRLEEMLDACEAEAERRGLDLAVWGHVSDGNLHPNIIPRSRAEERSGRDAVLAFGRTALQLGGASLAEHGVGRNPVKQQLLREMYGAGGIADMRRVKEALDPAWKLAPGVIFPRGGAPATAEGSTKTE